MILTVTMFYASPGLHLSLPLLLSLTLCLPSAEWNRQLLPADGATYGKVFCSSRFSNFGSYSTFINDNCIIFNESLKPYKSLNINISVQIHLKNVKMDHKIIIQLHKS